MLRSLPICASNCDVSSFGLLDVVEEFHFLVPPLCICQPLPLLEVRNMAPFATGPNFEMQNNGLGHSHWGGWLRVLPFGHMMRLWSRNLYNALMFVSYAVFAVQPNVCSSLIVFFSQLA